MSNPFAPTWSRIPLNRVKIYKSAKNANAVKGTDGMWAVEDAGTYQTGKRKGEDMSPYRNKVYVWKHELTGQGKRREWVPTQVGVMTSPGRGNGTTRTGLLPPQVSDDKTRTEWTDRDGELYQSVQGPGDSDQDIYDWALKTDRLSKLRVPRDIKKVSESQMNAAIDNKSYHPTLISGSQPPAYDVATRPERAPQPRYNPFDNWTKHKTDSGEKYFFNPYTRATSWNKPKPSFGRRRKRRRTRSRKRSRSRRRTRRSASRKRKRSRSRRRRRSRKKCHSRVRGHKRRSRRVRSHNRRRKCKRRKRRLSFGYPVVSPADCVTRTFGTTDSIPGAQTPSCYSLNPMEWFTTATGSQV